jgi:hypothetical protein
MPVTVMPCFVDGFARSMVVWNMVVCRWLMGGWLGGGRRGNWRVRHDRRSRKFLQENVNQFIQCLQFGLTDVQGFTLLRMPPEHCGAPEGEFVLCLIDVGFL